MVFRLDIGLKFARSDFGKPGFFSRGEISASLNLEGKVAWVKDRFAKCEMRIKKCCHMISEVMSGCNQAEMICLTLIEVIGILRQR